MITRYPSASASATKDPMPAPSSPIEITKFVKLSQVGEGTYGKVYKAMRHNDRHDSKREIVALKKIRFEPEREGFPITAMREIKLLQRLKHPNILCLAEIVTEQDCVYMVSEYMDHDLTGLMAHPTIQFTHSHIKCIVHQIFSGLEYLHRNNILHRDMKGSNILMNNLGQVKLADFGLARLCTSLRKQDYTNRVITLWYKPPELLLGATKYGSGVDVWGVGCIMAELFTRKPFFQGHDEISQLEAIYKLLGTPTVEIWLGIQEYPWYHLIRPNVDYSYSMDEAVRGVLPDSALEFLKTMLTMNPEHRVSSMSALQDTYFKDDPQMCMPIDLPRPTEGDWHEYETKKKKREAASQADPSNVRKKTRPIGAVHVSRSQASSSARS